MVSYEQIYSRVLSKIKEYEFVDLNISDIYPFLNEWIMSALSTPFIRKKFLSYELKTEEESLSYVLKNSLGNSFMDEQFVINIVALGVVIEWLGTKVYNSTLTNQMMGGKEEKFYSQQQHLATLHNILKSAKSELRQTISDDGYVNNTYINAE